MNIQSADRTLIEWSECVLGMAVRAVAVGAGVRLHACMCMWCQSLAPVDFVDQNGHAMFDTLTPDIQCMCVTRLAECIYAAYMLLMHTT
jgi:hypothetical protein